MTDMPPSPTPQRHQAERRPLPFETASLTLRAFVPEDAPKIFQMSQEDGMQAWLPNQVYQDEASAELVLASLILQYRSPGDPRLGAYVLGVQVTRNGALVGHVGFSPLGDAVEIGFAIERAHQRKGIATEAVRAACEWATDSFSLASIIGVTAAQNGASQGVLLRAGFARQREDVMRFQGREQLVTFFVFSRRR